ncbi:MAG: hypothetical protein IJV04_01130 [Lachnospiraceae bacterium]|nr:hypothetical protein [Oscillospiraceae bacterium]MBQ9631509.1 hypothetical protein [Lachnospiraceae bacterium]MBQ9695032.1 hypothetical protein [Oscillospiraceae bacterium]MBR1459718.1 hypothetical protein [Oscillospiraceae bacterium]MBR1898428.1 hypothetical protein [Oscillospiraceae bacterium]
MTVRDFLRGNRKLGRSDASPWMCMYMDGLPPVTLVSYNKITPDGEALSDREITAWHISHDQQDVDVVEFWVELAG